MKLLIALLMTSGLLFSCVQVKNLEVLDEPTPAKETEHKVYQNKLVYDLEVSESRVTGTAVGKKRELEKLKNDAIKSALSDKDDIIIEPKYKITSYRRLTTVTVTGFTGKFTNFRSVPLEELTIFDNADLTNVLQSNESNETSIEIKSRRRVLRTTIGSTLAGLFSGLFVIVLVENATN
jgi:hypothetical protein